MLQLFGLKVRSEGCTWICSQPFDPPQTEAWMIDRWGVLIGENSHNHANQAMSTPPTCSLPFCVPNDDDYAESWPSPCSQCTFFFFFLVILSSWSAFVWGETCCCRRTSSGLLGPRGRPSLLRCWHAPPYLRLDQTVLNTCSSVCTFGVNLLWHWPGFPQNCEGVAVFSSR